MTISTHKWSDACELFQTGNWSYSAASHVICLTLYMLLIKCSPPVWAVYLSCKVFGLMFATAAAPQSHTLPAFSAPPPPQHHLWAPGQKKKRKEKRCKKYVTQPPKSN